MATQDFTIASILNPAEAFALLIDLTNVPAWDSGVTDATLADGAPGMVGARYDVSLIGFDRQPTTAVYELTEVRSPHSFTMVGRHPDFEAADTVTCEPADGGCRVTYNAGLRLLGDTPPLSDEQLDVMFAKLVDTPRSGLARFLNPPQS